jgi:hypothetical protein
MAKGGKGGGAGGKVGGGKGGGAKGKTGGGGGGGGGTVTMCFNKADLSLITAAFNGAKESTSRADGCGVGLMVVRLDLGTTNVLVRVVLSGLQSGVKKKTKSGLTARPLATTKGGKNPAVAGSPRP